LEPPDLLEDLRERRPPTPAVLLRLFLRPCFWLPRRDLLFAVNECLTLLAFFDS
jgi:hypothetical protein